MKEKKKVNKDTKMYNKMEKQEKEQTQKKYELKSIINSYKTFYKENLKKKHIIVFVVMLFIFIIMLNFFITNSASIKNEIVNKQIIEKSFFDQVITEKIPLLALIIFAGITPFFFLPVMGIMGSYTLAFEISYVYILKESAIAMIIGSIGAIIQLASFSLSVVTGIYYCMQSTKKFRYNQYMSFGLKDVKRTFYEIRKDEEKLKKLQEVETKKAEKREKLNVKIPYINFIVSFVISMIVLTLGAIITSIVK